MFKSGNLCLYVIVKSETIKVKECVSLLMFHMALYAWHRLPVVEITVVQKQHQGHPPRRTDFEYFFHEPVTP